jgi:hypothetical protein
MVQNIINENQGWLSTYLTSYILYIRCTLAARSNLKGIFQPTPNHTCQHFAVHSPETTDTLNILTLQLKSMLHSCNNHSMNTISTETATKVSYSSHSISKTHQHCTPKCINSVTPSNHDTTTLYLSNWGTKKSWNFVRNHNRTHEATRKPIPPQASIAYPIHATPNLWTGD